MTTRHADVVVLGAGTAGANAAYQFARRGRDVLVLERRPAHEAGAQWVNGVLDWQFRRAGIEPPLGTERGRERERLHIRASSPSEGITMGESPTVAADMHLLGERLRRLAGEHGADILDMVARVEVETNPSTGRIRALRLRRESGAWENVTADLFVDASGRSGVLRRHARDLDRWCPTLTADELCTASDAHHRVADPDGARRFLERHGAVPGDTVTAVGVAGGFSTCAISISAELDRVGILVGCLANGRYSTGPRMVADVCTREPWIGEQLGIGSGVIPLRRPYARISAAGLALVGDSACQVFPAHGSGIGIGLIAGSVLADGVADSEDPGDEDVLWRSYQAPFQHEFGGDLAGYDALRRLTTRLGGAGVDELLRSGITDEHTFRSGLEQRWAQLSASEAAHAAVRIARHPRLARQVLPAILSAQILRGHARRHPGERDLAALERWDSRIGRLLGRIPA